VGKSSPKNSQEATRSDQSLQIDESTRPQESTRNTSDAEGEQLIIVGIGASAGGLAALKTLFSLMPGDSGLAFVVVMHLAPDRKSHLAELLQPTTDLRVQQVTETVALEPNVIYVIPPNANLDSIDTHLRLSDLERARSERAPIDHFFRTLASNHGDRSIGVVLTGSGSDGTLGLKEIKLSGGVAIVQDPNEAEYDGMPQSAVSTGVADLILPLAEIPKAIIGFTSTAPKLRLRSEQAAESSSEQVLQKIFAQLRARTGRDFTQYKRSTVMRRIGRRMQFRRQEDLAEYLAVLRSSPEEVRALADDLLITVTSFFRDPEVFQYVRTNVLPQIVTAKRDGEPIRIWSVGCATGEEAYSLAILVLETLAQLDKHLPIQIFASDLHEHSLTKAREGLYLGDIESDITSERLSRYFEKENGGYRVRKEVRELVVFAPHNLMGDPPFSRLDLISCRNLLIYLKRELQHEVIELFHYALKPDGFLVLGTSETLDAGDLFQVEEKKCCVYRRRNIRAPEPRLPVFPTTRPRVFSEAERVPLETQSISYGGLHQKIVERYAPPSILLAPDNRVVHLSENAGRYFEHPGGEITSNVFKILCEELRLELRTALHSARETGEIAVTKAIDVSVNGEKRPVVLHVRPSSEVGQQGYALVLFVEAATDPTPTSRVGGSDSDAERIQKLEVELHLTQQRLQVIVEEFESGQEELKASNEELQSANEELRSTLEELETSKEELQSLNEELQTLNQENRHKVEELAQLSSDLQNFLAATDIATLFLDRKFRIMRFTPRVAELFNVRMADRGRPLSDFTHRLGYDNLAEDAKRVLRTLVPIEREVKDESERWYLTRVLPYRSTEDRIDGVVITLVDITARKESERALRESEGRFRALIDASAQMVWTTDVEGRMVEDSPSWQAFTGQPYNLRRGFGWLDALHPADRETAEAKWREAVATKASLVMEVRVFHAASDEYRWNAVRAVPLLHPEGPVSGWIGMASDISDRKQAELALKQSEARLGEEVLALMRLHELVSRLLTSSDLPAALDEVLQAAIEITGADQGFVQLLVADQNRFAILASHGFESRTLKELAAAGRNDGRAPGRAISEGVQVVVGDVAKDSSYAPYHEAIREAGYRAEQATPLVSRNGESLGVLATQYKEPGAPTARNLRLLDLYARQAADFIERMRAEDLQRTLMGELDHRVKNSLATALSIAQQTLRSTDGLEQFRESFIGRLTALAEVHQLLTAHQWRGVYLETIVEAATKPFAQVKGPVVSISGERVLLESKAAQALHLVLHELATNAAKYGAFSRPEGKVDVHWSMTQQGRSLMICWEESGGPAVPPEREPGFGTRLIERTLRHEVAGEARLDFRASGLYCELQVSLPDRSDANATVKH
ncbi:MAG: PAS domain-containing protein, partial [Bdellovibrionales bacterium]|nr:PAS domain-containing protein [Bdellovibrionales bacterium]